MFTLLKVEGTDPDGNPQLYIQGIGGLPAASVEHIKVTLPIALKDSNKNSSGRGTMTLTINGSNPKTVSSLGWSEYRANEDRLLRTIKGYRQKKAK